MSIRVLPVVMFCALGACSTSSGSRLDSGWSAPSLTEVGGAERGPTTPAGSPLDELALTATTSTAVGSSRTLAAAPVEAGVAAPLPLVGDAKQSMRIKVGAFTPANDIDFLDTGYAVEATFARELLPILAIEGTLGYLSADGPASSNLWAIPAFINGRFQLPILIVEAHAGAGVGGMYVDYDFAAAKSDDFVFAWDAFLGVQVGLGNLALGAEYKYVSTETTKDGFQVDGHLTSLYLSLPF